MALLGTSGVMSRWLCHRVTPGCPHAEHCLFIHLIFFSIQLVLQLRQQQIKANSPKKPRTINSDVADAAIRDVSEELTELVSLLGDMSWVHLTCGVKPRSHYLTSALFCTCKRLNYHYTFVITLLTRQLYSISFLHARFRFMHSTRHVSWPGHVVIPSTAEVLVHFDISGCLCFPAICSTRTRQLGIDFPSAVGLNWAQKWGICSDVKKKPWVWIMGK